MNNKNILLVDDDNGVLASYGTFLSNEHNLVTAKNGLLAINAIARQKIDLIILDVNIPEIDGETLANVLNKNEQWKRIPILMISGYQKPLNDLPPNVKVFLGKPVAREELNYSIKNLLQEYH